MKKLQTIFILALLFLTASPIKPQEGKPTVNVLKSEHFLTINTEWKYQVKIPLPANPLPVKFKMSYAPKDMKIDSLIGLVTWTPKEAGEYIVEAVAYSSVAKYGIEVLIIRVAKGFGTIAGTTKNDDGAAIPLAQVSIHKKVTLKDSKENFQMVRTVLTDAKGFYQFTNIEVGSYYVQARPTYEKMMFNPTAEKNVIYLPVWYVDSPTMDKAAPVELKETQKLEINLTMHQLKITTPVLISVTGKVTDSNDKPIAGAIVFVSLVPKPPSGAVVVPAGSSIMTLNDKLFGFFPNVIGKAITDKEGNYKLAVKGGGTYYALSYAMGYLLQYYNGKNNALEADKLELKADAANINFKLTKVPEAKAKVSGSVADDSKSPVVAKVMLFPVKLDILPYQYFNPFIKSIRSVHTDDKGLFTFEGVPSGEYLIQVVPFKDYLPAFYKANDCGVRERKLSETIIIKNDISVTDLKVCVKKATAKGGGKISGIILGPDQKGLPGVIVFAEDTNQSASSYSITEYNGSYEIADLDPADYSLSAEKVGFSSSSKRNSTIDYGLDLFSSSANFSMISDGLTDISTTSEIPTSFALYQNYPNPFNPSTTIEFALPISGKYTLKIYNILGQELTTLVSKELTPGTHKIKFEAGRYASGVYIYQLTGANVTLTKKMLLVK